MAVVAVAVVAVAVGVYAATRTISVPGQKLGEIARQTAKEGEPRVIVYGVVRPIGGNLVAVQEPPRIIRKKQKSGGKGGGGSKTYTEVPVRTYAVGICEGPITGIRRIWRNNKLVYADNDSLWGIRNNRVFLRTARLYLGGYDQMPSPDLEAVFGAGNVPAMRGTAYMVMANEELADTGGAVPQWTFEVERAEGYVLTSRPYPVEAFEYATVSGGGLLSGDHRVPPVINFADSLDQSGGGLLAGEHRDLLQTYSYVEAVDQGGGLLAGEFNQILRRYSIPIEAVDQGGGLLSGDFRTGLIKYDRWPIESVYQSGGGLLGGVHGN